MNKSRDQENYYQTIAKRLFEIRGAPFILSPKENEAIKTWEKQQIPLNIIVEGIETAFESCTPGLKKKLRLYNCNRHVMRRFQQYRERRVGKDRQSASSHPERDKKDFIQREIRKFLKQAPAETAFLIPLFKTSLTCLRSGSWEEELEKRDQQIDTLIWERIPADQKEKAKNAVQREHDVAQSRELERLAQLKTIKQFRETYQVPYLSPYYY